MAFRERLIPLAVIGGLLLVTVIAILVVTDRGTPGPPAGATVTLETYDIETGEAVTGACFSLEGEGNGACDAESTGRFAFARPVPPGSYVVGYERTAHGDHLTVGDFPLVVPDTADHTVLVAFVRAGEGVDQWVDVSVVVVPAGEATRDVPPDSCLTIHGAAVTRSHAAVEVCGQESEGIPMRTGTFLLTSAVCDTPRTGQMWIAITGPTIIEVPLTLTGCIDE